MKKLRGKNALITGSGQGIGKAIAEELANAGCNIAIHYFSSKTGACELRNQLQSLPVKAECFQADLTVESEVSSLILSAYDFLGGLDILINNSGDLLERRFIDEIDLTYWQKIGNINLTSMMMTTKHAIPFMARNSSSAIINLSSLAGRAGGHPGSLAYSTVKGAVLTWTRSLAVEVAAQGIRVNAVAPGFILGTRFHATHTTEDSAAATVAGIPLGRAGTPVDVARAVSFLAAEHDGFITGATLDINGGVYRM